MDYEKKYKEALGRARICRKDLMNLDGVVACMAKDFFEETFPELKESEDEKSKKWILEYLYDGLRKSDEQFKDQFKAAISWLEKQGEQKSTWNKEDEVGFGDAMWAIEQAKSIAKDENDMGNLWYAEKWLKSIKERMKGE